MRLRAQPPEERAVPRHDVVGVEAVEPGRLRPSDERRVAEDAHAGERRERLGPGGGRIAVRVVDVEVGEPAFSMEARDVLGRARRRPAAVRLDVDRHRRGPIASPPPRRASSRSCSGESNPHHETTTVPDARRGDLAHLRQHDLRVRRRVQAAGREVRRREHRARRRARRTSAPNAPSSPGSSTRGSRRSPRARSLRVALGAGRRERRRRPPRSPQRGRPVSAVAVNAARDSTARPTDAARIEVWPRTGT